MDCRARRNVNERGRPESAAPKAAGSVSAKPAVRWRRSDLIRRVVNALDVASRMVRSLVEMEASSAGRAAEATSAGGLLREKIVAETAMLLLCVEPVRGLDERIREQAEVVARLLIPHARHADVLAGICLDPGLARDLSVGHAILSRLGYPDPDVDDLLSKSLAMGPDFGPERLPHRRLEQAWLARVWHVVAPPRRHDRDLVAESLLGRPMDALGSTRLDIYAFTHAVMYASDLGSRRIAWIRPPAAVAADADAALAFSLDSNDYDLTAEVLMTWPMLRLDWSAAATFAFGILADMEDRLGFLPGSAFDPARYQAAADAERSRLALSTSYHAAYVMGFLCAAALRRGCTPPAAVPLSGRAQGAGAALRDLAGPDRPATCWKEPFIALAPRQQDAIAPLLLAVTLRRARAEGNLRLIRGALQVALAFDLVDGPAPSQAAALLRRSRALDPRQGAATAPNA
jgi:uncharacterized protein DUF6895